VLAHEPFLAGEGARWITGTTRPSDGHGRAGCSPALVAQGVA
jgi:hypothetical protein